MSQFIDFPQKDEIVKISHRDFHTIKDNKDAN